jgi:TIR domain
MPAETPRLFVSYSREDEEFALKLATDLRARGTNIWVDQLDIRTGARWDSDVEEGLRASPGLLVILSPSSVLSQNVMDEVAFALSEGKWILPVLHKPCAIPFRLRRLQYVDFVGGYDEGLRRLVSDIAATFAAQPSTAASFAPPPVVRPAPGARPEASHGPRVENEPPGQDVESAPVERRGWFRENGVPGVALVVLILMLAVYTISENIPSSFFRRRSPSVSDPPPAGDEASYSVSTAPEPETAPPASRWTSGTKHSTQPHVVAAEKEGEWTPENGYQWVDANAAGDLRVQWSPGKKHNREDNVVAANKEGQWSPAPGYEWINAADANDLRVKLKPPSVE